MSTLPSAPTSWSVPPVAAGVLRDVQQLRRHLGSLPRLGRAPAPAPTAAPLASLTALLETLRAHADEARRGVAPETSALRLNESVLWGTPEGGWGCVGAADHSAAASSACPASPAAAFLAPLLWQVRLVGAPQGAPPPNWRGAVQRPNSRQPPPAPAWNATARANRMRALGPPRPVAPFISAVRPRPMPLTSPKPNTLLSHIRGSARPDSIATHAGLLSLPPPRTHPYPLAPLPLSAVRSLVART